MNTAFFAPKLEASRWAFLFGDPAKSAKTLLNVTKWILWAFFGLAAVLLGLGLGAKQSNIWLLPAAGLAFAFAGAVESVTGPHLWHVDRDAHLLHYLRLS